MRRNLPWKTNNSRQRRHGLEWPSAGQLLSQLGIIVLVSLLWGVLLAGYLWLTDAPGLGVAKAQRQGKEEVKVAAKAGPSETPTLRPTGTATSLPTSTPQEAAPTARLVVPAATKVATVVPTATHTPPPQPPSTPVADPSTPAGNTAQEISFKNDVLPILERRCVQCHGGEKTEQGLGLKTYADLMAGSQNGSVIEPGDVKKSYLVEQIVKGKMPKKGPHLLPAEIRAIIAWVEAGAPNN